MGQPGTRSPGPLAVGQLGDAAETLGQQRAKRRLRESLVRPETEAGKTDAVSLKGLVVQGPEMVGLLLRRLLPQRRPAEIDVRHIETEAMGPPSRGLPLRGHVPGTMASRGETTEVGGRPVATGAGAEAREKVPAGRAKARGRSASRLMPRRRRGVDA